MASKGSAMTFAYATWHPGTDGPAPTVVALHGHGANAQDLLGLAPYLAEIGFNSLSVCSFSERFLVTVLIRMRFQPLSKDD